MPKICIDAGHFGKQNWNKRVDPIYYESLHMWDLHLLYKEELEKYEGITVITTRQDEEKDLDLMKRGQTAYGCNLFLSLHSNATASGKDEGVDRAVVIYPVSGKEYNLAAALAQSTTEVMGLRGKPNIYSRWNSSHTSDWYGVIRGATSVGVPGLLIEHSFHTHDDSARWLQNAENLRKLAEKNAAVIAARFGCQKKPENPDTNDDDYANYTPPFRVIIGAFNNPKNAIAYRDHAKKDADIYPDAYCADKNGRVLK